MAQSGGPTAVINSSLAGVIQEAGKHECIEEIYGGANGILGLLNEELIDINEEKARSIEGRLSRSEWVVGDNFSAADIMIFPALQLLLRALDKPAARALSSRFLPLAANYPALERWIGRVAALPGYERTFPPHWR